jgi:hypothetical protein
VHHKFGADLRFEDKFINQSNEHIEKSSTNTKIDEIYYLATTKNIISSIFVLVEDFSTNRHSILWNTL